MLDVTGRPAEDFETIARRYAEPFRNQRTFGNRLREFVQFPSEPQFAPESKVWRREHGISDATNAAASIHKTATSAIRRTQWLESQ